MKTIYKKILSLGLAFFVFVQFSFAPRPAQAGSLDTVKTVLGLIETALGPSWPLPIKATEIFAIIGVIEICTDTSDAGLMVCVENASNDPWIGPLLQSSAGVENIKLGLAIYIDIKNGDYIQLIKDGGKPIGCAAAAILTGFNVCEALEELIALAEAVGDAAAYAMSWLDDLDVALFGQTAHMNQDQYFANRWRPYIRGYAALKVKGAVNDDTAITPYAPQWVFNNGGTYAEFGLFTKNMNQVYQDCLGYYAGFKDGNGPNICNNNKSAFAARVDLLFKVANTTAQFAPVLQPILDGQNKIWNDKVNDFKNDLVKKFPEYDVLNQTANPKWVWEKYENFTKSTEKKIGKITPGTYCTDNQSWECVDLDKGAGTCCGTIAGKTFSSLYDCNFKTSPQDAANQAVGDAQTELKNYFNWMKSGVEGYWQTERENQNTYKKMGFIADAKNKIYSLRAICKTLKHSRGGDTYYSLCYNTEPLKSCYDKIDSISNQQVSAADSKATDDYIAANKPAIDHCVNASDTVVKQWQRMDNLYTPFIDGWYNYYLEYYKANKNKGDKDNSIPKEKMAFSLEVAYSNCASNYMEDVIEKAINASNGQISKFVGKPIQAFKASDGVSKKLTGANAKKIFENSDSSTKIAEGFCSSEGQSVATPNMSTQPTGATDPSKIFENNGTTPVNDPTKRDPNMLAEAKQAAGISGCAVSEFTDNKGKHKDDFHLVCENKESYDKCVKSLGGDIRPSKAKCAVWKGQNIATDWVIGPCCEAKFQADTTAAELIKKHDFEKSAGVDGSKSLVADKKDLLGVKTFKVTVSAGMGGSVSPMGMQTVMSGKTTTFTVTASPGHKIKSVTGCGAKVKMGNIYETESISADCNLAATFEAAQALQMRQAPGAATPIRMGHPTIAPHTNPASSTTIPIQAFPPGGIKRK